MHGGMEACRTVRLAEEALDGRLARLDHVQFERGSEEPLPHQGATQWRVSDVDDACVAWFRTQVGRSERADAPKRDRPSFVERECAEACDSSQKIWRELRKRRSAC